MHLTRPVRLPALWPLTAALKQRHIKGAQSHLHYCSSARLNLEYSLLYINQWLSQCCVSVTHWRLTLVAQTAHPAFLTQTLPGLLTRAVHTPGERHTAVAVLTLPSWFAPEHGSNAELLIHHPQRASVLVWSLYRCHLILSPLQT